MLLNISEYINQVLSESGVFKLFMQTCIESNISNITEIVWSLLIGVVYILDSVPEACQFKYF